MRPDGLWHPELLSHLAAMGHGEEIVIADPGLPVAGVPRIDLVWRAGEPAFQPVLTAVLEELVVEAAFVAEEATDPVLLTGLHASLRTIPTERISHDELKRRARAARVVVRTGETTPYANAILRCGVPF
jgi:D-ribose pyranase